MARGSSRLLLISTFRCLPSNRDTSIVFAPVSVQYRFLAIQSTDSPSVVFSPSPMMVSIPVPSRFTLLKDRKSVFWYNLEEKRLNLQQNVIKGSAETFTNIYTKVQKLDFSLKEAHQCQLVLFLGLFDGRAAARVQGHPSHSYFLENWTPADIKRIHNQHSIFLISWIWLDV